MAYGMLVLPPQDARKFIELIGKDENAKVQFEDMNLHGMKRPYKKYIQRIDEMERILRFIHEEIGSNTDLEIERNHIEEFLAHETYQLDPVEKELSDLYKQFVKFQENNTQIVGEITQAHEEVKVMETAINWLKHSASSGDLAAPLLSSERRLNNVAGRDRGGQRAFPARALASFTRKHFRRVQPNYRERRSDGQHSREISFRRVLPEQSRQQHSISHDVQSHESLQRFWSASVQLACGFG